MHAECFVVGGGVFVVVAINAVACALLFPIFVVLSCVMLNVVFCELFGSRGCCCCCCCFINIVACDLLFPIFVVLSCVIVLWELFQCCGGIHVHTIYCCCLTISILWAMFCSTCLAL